MLLPDMTLTESAMLLRFRILQHAWVHVSMSLSLCRLCYVLDVIYDKRPIQRFWFLEVVARMPYFSYISMLHLYESLGWWRAGAELRRVSTQKPLIQHRPHQVTYGVSWSPAHCGPLGEPMELSVLVKEDWVHPTVSGPADPLCRGVE